MRRKATSIVLTLLIVCLSMCTADRPILNKTVYRIYMPVLRGSNLYAWVQGGWKETKVRPQFTFCDVRQDRQYITTPQSGAECADKQPGLSMFLSDEPDTWTTVTAYAEFYHEFVIQVLAVDPTAKVSPAGISQNGGTAWAQQFYDEYIRLYGSPPPVHEWRLHAFCDGNLTNWKELVNGYINWVNGKNGRLFVGSFGLPNYSGSDALDIEREMLIFINESETITGAAWWSYDSFSWTHTLINSSGELNADGLMFLQY